MRALSAVVLFCVLALGMSGSLRAAEITAVNAQLLVNAAQKAAPAVATDVTLMIGDKEVVFTVICDALGSVTAVPKVSPASAGITTTQVNIQLKANDKGILTPFAMVVLASDKSITKHLIVLNTDNTIASLDKPAVSAADGGTPVGGVGGAQDGNKKAVVDVFANPFLSVSGGGQLPLPAGCESGKISVWQP